MDCHGANDGRGGSEHNDDCSREMIVMSIAVVIFMVWLCTCRSTNTVGAEKLRMLCPVRTQLFLGLSKPRLVSRIHNEGNSVAVIEIFLPDFSQSQLRK